MATGIFLFNTLTVDWLTWESVALTFGATVLILFCLYRGSGYNRRFLFGVVGGVAFALLGGMRVLMEHERVYFTWDGKKQLYCGVIETVPEVRGKTLQAEVRLSSVRSVEDTLPPRMLHHSILLYWVSDSLAAPLCCGDSVCFYGQVSRPSFKEAGFDYAVYLERKGISGTAVAFSGHWKRLPGSRRLTLRQHAAVMQRKISEVYRSWGLRGEELAVVSALTVGDKRELTPGLRVTYNAAGASHVLALSGLHVGILAGMLMGLFYPFTRFRSGRQIVSFAVVALLWAFAFIAGLSPSVVRAVTMFSLYVLASLLTEGRFSGMPSLVFAAFLMLLYQPFYLFDVSFQLSFVAVASILCFYPLISAYCPFQHSGLRYVWNILALSFVAQLGTLPFVLYYFGTFPSYFLLANLFVSPLAVCILGSALASFLLAPVPLVGKWAVCVLQFSAEALNTSMAWVKGLSGSQLTSLHVSGFQALLLCVELLMVYAYGLYHKRYCLIGMLLLADIFILSLFF